MHRSVLIIDDSPAIRLTLRRYFMRRHWVVDEAEDGRTALTKLLAGAPDRREYALIVSDLRMPGLSGTVIYDALTVARPELLTRIVFSTSDAASIEAVRFLRRACCAVIQKPFDVATLDRVVMDVCGTDG